MKIGSLCSGYGGLDMAAERAFDAETAWFVEYDDAPSKILAHHWPTVPNYGDMTTLDWATVPPIDVLTAGYPCQPFSTAGKRKGSTDERHLWPYVLDAIRHLRPGIVVLENVRGHLSLGFDRVLGDLAEVGYDTRWLCIPASATGAPHRRERIFILAQDTDRAARDQRGLAAPGQAEGGRAWPDAGGRGGAPATDANDTARDGERSRPEPGQGDPVAPDPDYAGLGGIGGLEPSERDADGRGSADQAWGDYEPAIRRWEPIVGRHAPAPTLPDGRAGNHRLNSAFVEWMMGLPAGHVTDVGLTRNEELKALGNGVVPQQAQLAVSLLANVDRSNA